MELPIFFPNLKQGSTKDCIIRILTMTESLTNQKIFNSLKREYRISRSYQTIRQALIELVESGVLTKQSKYYSISIEWIKSTEKYIQLLKTKYVDKKDIKLIDKNTKEIHMKSLHDLGHFILYSFRDHFFDTVNENRLYMYVQHLWIPFADGNKRNMLREFFSRTNNFVYVANSSFGDKLLANFYNKYCKLKFNIKLDKFFDFIIQGDCIAKVYLPNKLRKRMDNVYSLKNLNFKFLKEIEDLTYSEYPIKIIINRDKNICNEIKSQLLTM